MAHRSTSIKFSRTTFSLFLSICFMICILSFILGFQLGRTNKPVYERGRSAPQTIPTDPFAESAVNETPQMDSTEDLSFYQSLRRRTPSMPFDRPTEVATRPTARPTQQVPPTPTPIVSLRPTVNTNAELNGKFTVQVASLTSREKAEALIKTLQEHGFPAFVSESPLTGNQILYRVRVGQFTTREAAQYVAQEIKNREKLETWISPLN